MRVILAFAALLGWLADASSASAAPASAPVESAPVASAPVESAPVESPPAEEPPAPSPAPPAAPASADGDAAASFAPTIEIEAIEVVGNSITAERLIRRALPVRVGEQLRADDARLRAARYKVLALGFFRDVTLRLRRGSARGQVILTVEVVERGTVVLDRMYFGTTLITPWWAGLDLTERNLFGTGLAVGGAFVFAGQGDAQGATDQKAFALRVADPSVMGSSLGWHATLHYVDASEPYRVGGDDSDGSAGNFSAFDYRRVGGRAGVTFNLTPLTRLIVDGRYDHVRADLPDAPTRNFGDRGDVPIDLFLDDGTSRVATVSVGIDRDSRPDPVLPYTGDHLQALAEVSAGPLSSYDFASFLVRYERWMPLAGPAHVLSFHLSAGLVVGDAARFDRIYVGDVNRMVSPRALGLVVSTTPPLDVFSTGSDQLAYGDVAGAAELQYSYRLFRNRGHVYGGDLFVGAGFWTLSELDRFRRDTIDGALNVDVLLDAGLRLDTEIGIFELSLANGLGRVPL